MPKSKQVELSELYHSDYTPKQSYIDTINMQAEAIKELKSSLDTLSAQNRRMARVAIASYPSRTIARGMRGVRKVTGKEKILTLKILMYNAADCDNLGDDLIIKSAQNYFTRYLPGSDIKLATREPKTSLGKADIVMVGPGGIIYDFDTSNVDNYCNVIEHANHLQKPIYMIGVGTQGIAKKASIERYRRALPLVRILNVRDQTDADYLLGLNLVNPQTLLTTCDFAFMRGFSRRPVMRAGGRPKLLLSLADWRLGAKNYDAIEPGLNAAVSIYKQYVIEHATALKKRFDIIVLAQAREDREFANELGKALGIDPIIYEQDKNYEQVIHLYMTADIVVTSRYHGLILGVTSGALTVPVALPGNKTERLVNSRFPSLLGQLYTVKEFAQSDVLNKLLDPSYNLKHPTWRERQAIKKSLKPLRTLVDDINSYFGIGI